MEKEWFPTGYKSACPSRMDFKGQAREALYHHKPRAQLFGFAEAILARTTVLPSVLHFSSSQSPRCTKGTNESGQVYTCAAVEEVFPSV